MDRQLFSKSRHVAMKIRQVREQRNYSQEYLAAKLSISQNAYSKIELGHTRITLDRLFHIADILEVEAVSMLSGEGQPRNDR